MSRLSSKVFERLRKLHYRGDSPLILSRADYQIFFDELNARQEAAGKDPYLPNTPLMYKERLVTTNPEEVRLAEDVIEESKPQDNVRENPRPQEPEEALSKSDPVSSSKVIVHTLPPDKVEPTPALRLKK